MKVHWLEWVKARYNLLNEKVGFKYTASMPTAVAITLVAAAAITICATPVVTPFLSLAAAVSTVPIINQLTFVVANVFFYGSTALGAAVGWRVIAVPVIHGVEFLYDSVLTPIKRGFELVANPIKSMVGGITEYFGSLFASDKEKEKKKLEDEKAKAERTLKALEAEKASIAEDLDAIHKQKQLVDDAVRRVESAPSIEKPAERFTEKVNEKAAEIKAGLEAVSSSSSSIGVDVTNLTMEELQRMLLGGEKVQDRSVVK